MRITFGSGRVFKKIPQKATMMFESSYENSDWTGTAGGRAGGACLLFEDWTIGQSFEVLLEFCSDLSLTVRLEERIGSVLSLSFSDAFSIYAKTMYVTRLT